LVFPGLGHMAARHNGLGRVEALTASRGRCVMEYSSISSFV
jgi:hypothetical protein